MLAWGHGRYLDNLNIVWQAMYAQDPCGGAPADLCKLILGGHGEMWGETVDASDVLPTVWPKLAAIAERLWSPSSVNNVTAAAPRLHAHRCRMLTRGLPAQVDSAPSYSPDELSDAYVPPWGPE